MDFVYNSSKLYPDPSLYHSVNLDNFTLYRIHEIIMELTQFILADL